MIDELRKSVVTKYQKLCRSLKINNWQKNVFMSNSIEILVEINERVEALEKENKTLKDQIKKLK